MAHRVRAILVIAHRQDALSRANTRFAPPRYSWQCTNVMWFDLAGGLRQSSPRDTLRKDMNFIKTLSVWVPLAAGPHTVREISLAETQDWGFALWSAGAPLPLWLRRATRYTPGNNWRPGAKAPSRPAHSTATLAEPRAWSRVEQIYCGQYWHKSPMAPPPTPG